MHARQFYIDSTWVDPVSTRTFTVVDPASGRPVTELAMGGAADVDRAVAAARAAFPGFSTTSSLERAAMLERILAGYQARYDEIVTAITREMGAPAWLSKRAQAATGTAHLKQAISVLKHYEFAELRGTTLVQREAIGVCGLITPWNWPINQVMVKLAPALAAGCTVVLKPSEYAPLSALILAEIIDEAGLPKGVFNLVNGDGPTVGNALAMHRDIDMISFTGSTRAGVLVAKAAADTVKRVHQELGGKSANIILGDADLAKAVSNGVKACFMNTGQSCNAPTRMLVQRDQYQAAVQLAKAAAQATIVGDPSADSTVIGPLANANQFRKVREMIELGIAEGAALVTGGAERPAGLDNGYYVQPTVFAEVRADMAIAREEIFGPVLVMMSYVDEEDALAIANDTPFGLAGYVQSGTLEHARNVGARLRVGTVHLNGAGPDFAAPFGGYKQSGNGREWGAFGMEEFMEVKAMMGYEAAKPRERDSAA
jgi:aldehyde dehydrogenase (NAD+)